MQPFRLTSTGHNINYLPQYIAQRHGFFREQGLDFAETIPVPWDGVLDALADGIADMALGGIWVPSMYRGRVQDYTVFAQIANRCPLALLKRNDGKEFDLATVARRTVLMKSGGGASVGLFFKMLLREYGIDERSVDYIQDLDGKMLGDLFQGGMGDYFVTDILSARAMAAKNTEVSIGLEMVTEGDIPWSVYYRETKTITPAVCDAAKRFCAALYKGIEWVLEHEAETFQEELADLFPGVPVDIAVGVVNTFRRSGMWTSPKLPQGGFDRWQTGLHGARLISEPIAYNGLVLNGPAADEQPA